MFKLILKLLAWPFTGEHPAEMPSEMWEELKKEHPEFRNRRDFADHLVDECDFTYGEAFCSLPKSAFDKDGNLI